MEELERQIKEIQAQIVYWNERVFDASPQNMDMLNTTVTSLQYVLYNLEKIKASYEQNPPRH